MQRSAYGPAIVEVLKDRILSMDDVERQLHIIYLANDILFNRFGFYSSLFFCRSYINKLEAGHMFPLCESFDMLHSGLISTSGPE